jgi:hypothetical protein
MARLPLITQRRDIDVRVVYGQNIFELYQQIQNLLQREAPDLANFFAEPIVNAVRGEVTWNTRVSGVPRLAADLSPERWSEINQRLMQHHDALNQLMSKLERAGRGNSTGAEALRGMLMTPDLRQSLFLVGDELVLTQWGCYKYGTDAQSADLFEQIERPRQPVAPPSPTSSEVPPAPQGPTPPSPPSPAPDIPAPTHTSAVPDPLPPTQPGPPERPTPVVEPTTEVVEHSNQLWRWLVLLLLLILLVIGILWKYWQSHDWGFEARLRAEVAELLQQVENKARECGLQPGAPQDGTRPRDAPSPEVPSPEAPVPPVSVTNEEFRERQNENRINPNSKVNVSLAWNDRADLDLFVEQPDRQLVFFKPCESATCGTLDIDANWCPSATSCADLRERPLENISWRGEMQRGRYRVLVRLWSINQPATEIRPIPFTVQVTKDGKSTTYQGVFRSEDMACTDRCTVAPRHITEFTIE